jgi:TolB-like protein/Flp pilus assembly protein TadD
MVEDEGKKSSLAAPDPPGTSASAGVSRSVFLSYASDDAEIANAVCAYLESRGILCWMAPRDVQAGALYADAIVRAINEAKALVVVLSQSAVASSHVGKEIERASSKKKKIIAFRIDPAPLTPALEYFLSESQWIDIKALGMQAALAKLKEAVGQGAAAVNTADPVKTTKPGGRSRRLVIGAAVTVGVALAVVVGVHFWRSNHIVAQATVAAISDKSIAVLPFTDMSEKHDQEYFGDGMAEEILDLLAKIPGLTVIGRTSSFQFKGRNEDLRSIGAKLNAAYILEGSVRKAGEQVRITAQLINTKTGTHEWSETYDRRFDDVLKLQDAIAAAVAREMQLSVASGYLGSRGVLKSAESYDLMLRARHAGDRWDKEGLDEALLLIQQALERDPTSADAAAQLAMMYVREGEAGYMSPTQAFEKARNAAEAAIAIDPKNTLAHNMLARIHIAYDWDWAAAAQELEHAYTQVPGEGGALDTEALLSLALGRWDDALRQINLALARDPLDPKNSFAVGELQFQRGRLSEAEAAYRRALDIHPTFPWAHASIGLVRIARGEKSAALDEINQEPTDLGKQFGLAVAYHALGREADSNAALERLLADGAEGNAYMIAQAYAYRGQLDEAMHWLDRAYADKDPFLFYAKVELSVTPLGSSPRFKEFLRKMNLPG